MKFRILGPLSVTGPSGCLDVVAPRQSIVLTMLLAECRRVVSVERLVEAVWDESPPQTAIGQVQICVSALRRALAKVGLPGLLQTHPAGYRLMADPDDVDMMVFQRLVADARCLSGEGKLDEAASAYKQALDLWRGETLGAADSVLLRAAGTRLDEIRGRAIEEHIDLRLNLGAHRDVLPELFDLVSMYPLREHLRAQLMLALYRSGRQADALLCYREARLTFVEELGIEPSAELRNLEQAILLGESDYELVPPAPGPTRSRGPMPFVPAQLLPPDLPDYTGRDQIVAQVEGVLADAPPRPEATTCVVSLFGKGGIGKTALAVHTAHKMAHRFPDGQLYAKLNGSTATPLPPERVLERFLRSFGMPGSEIPLGLDERAEAFRNLIADRRVLVVLDDVADEEQISSLLPGSGPAVVLTTSRHRMTVVPWAHQLECQVLEAGDAVELMARVAGCSRIYAEPSQALQLAELCGHLPLALRIVAARLQSWPHWTVRKMVQRLSQRGRRLDELSHGGNSVRASIALSYDALDDQAKRLFRYLGMLEARDFGEWVGGPLLGVEDGASDDSVGALVAAQLLDIDTAPDGRPRLRFHDLIRAYARERLFDEGTEADRDAALRRVLGAWLSAAEKAHRREYGGDHTVVHGSAPRWPISPELVDRISADPLSWYAEERSAVVAMIRQAADAGADDHCWDLAFTMVTFFEAGSYFSEWRMTHDVALAAVRRVGNRLGEAAMLYSLGSLALVEYRLDESANLLHSALSIFEELDELHGQALATRNLAFVDRVSGRLDQARDRYDQAAGWLHELGDVVGEAHVMAGMANLALAEHDHATVTALARRALNLISEDSCPRVAAQLRFLLGEASLMADDPIEAQVLFRRVLENVRDLRDRIGEAYALYGLGLSEMTVGDVSAAVVTLRYAEQVAAESGDRMVRARILLAQAECYFATETYDRATRITEDALRLFVQLGAPMWQARSLWLLGRLHQAEGTPSAAEMVWRKGLAAASGIPSADARLVSGWLTDALDRSAPDRSSHALGSATAAGTRRIALDEATAALGAR